MTNKDLVNSFYISPEPNMRHQNLFYQSKALLNPKLTNPEGCIKIRTVYSYGLHYPIITSIRSNDFDLWIKNTVRVSVTTSKHSGLFHGTEAYSTETHLSLHLPLCSSRPIEWTTLDQLIINLKDLGDIKREALLEIPARCHAKLAKAQTEIDNLHSQLVLLYDFVQKYNLKGVSLFA